jgi:hypothetical protein
MRNWIATRQEMKGAISRLLFTEAEVGLNFAQAARNAPDTWECLRCRRVARRAYETILKWKNYDLMSDHEAERLRAKVSQLREMLRSTGDPLLVRAGRETNPFP